MSTEVDDAIVRWTDLSTLQQISTANWNETIQPEEGRSLIWPPC